MGRVLVRSIDPRAGNEWTDLGEVPAAVTWEQPEEVPQHLEALEQANRVRFSRAVLKRLIKSGEVRLSDVLLDPPEYLKTCPIGEMVRAQDRWGRARTRELLIVAEISEKRPIGKLTLRQRKVLADLLGG